MKLTTVIGTAIAALSLAACGSTATPTARPSTPTPTVASTPTATPEPTPPAPTPTATPTAKPGITVTVTCSNVLDNGQFANTGFPPGTILGNATFHGVTVGDFLTLGSEFGGTLVTSDPFSGLGAESPGSFAQGPWDWAEWSPPAANPAEVAHGTFTIPACPGKSLTPPPAPTA